jgi:hypothetical protein
MKNVTKYSLTFLFMLSFASGSWAQCLITVTAPQGGTNLGCGNNIITWTSQNTSGYVKIEYYCDGSWTEIISGTPDDGSYGWYVPSGTCCEIARIRVTDLYDNCTDSSGDFSINCECSECQINITAPTSGENLDCGPYIITWTSQNTSGNVKILYHCNGTWHTITSNTPDDGSYIWTIPPGTCCQGAKIEISDISDNSCFDQSGSLTIDCNCECLINVTSPTSGETIGCGQTITWTSQNTSGNVQIEYYCNGDWHPIVFNTPDDGSYDWIDFYPQNGCCDSTLIRISDALDLQCFGASEPFIFSCHCCDITVTQPNGGEIITCTLGPTDPWSWEKIKWTSMNTSGMVKIEYFCDSLWHVITPATPDDGEYGWMILPDYSTDSTCCDTAFIKITDVQNPFCYDFSDSAFTINCGCEDCTIDVKYPNGGEIITCTLGPNDPWSWEKIKWTSWLTSGMVKIEYYCDGLWHVITPSTPDDGEYGWMILPDSMTDSTCCDTAIIKITDVQNPLCYDFSDSAFTITCGCDSNCSINVTSPTAGMTVSCGHTITWSSQNTSGNVQIEYYCDGDWHPIVFNTPDDGSYVWNDFYPPSGCCDSTLIRVSDALDLQCFDINGPFIFNCDCEDWFYKKSDGDSIKYGIPDFDQKQDSWQAWRIESIIENVWTHCGPVAVANCLWWYDSRIQADYGHKVDLVKAYGPWHDKNINNVRPFVEDLARRCRTNMPYPWSTDEPRLGTDIYDMRVGINSLLYDSQLDTFLYVHKEQAPLWENVIKELRRCQDVILLLGIYGINKNTQQWERIGGHYVTMAGFSIANPPWIGISDPFLDHAEGDQGIGNPPHDAYVHNNSNRISGPHGTDAHDPYIVGFTPCTSNAAWELPTYNITQQMFYNFWHQNDYHPSLYNVPVYPDTVSSDTMCVSSEYALYVSPYEGSLGSIGGMKTDNSGNFIEGWKIKLNDSNGNLLDVTFTDIYGRFLFGGLGPASYTIAEGNVSGWQSVSPAGGKYTITLNTNEHIRDLEFVNNFTGTSIDEKLDEQLPGFKLERNYPNPFNSSTVIKYELPKSTSISLIIYNSLGQETKTLFEGFKDKGTYQHIWDGSNFKGEKVSNGIYFVKLRNDRNIKTIKILLIQ